MSLGLDGRLASIEARLIELKDRMELMEQIREEARTERESRRRLTEIEKWELRERGYLKGGADAT